jgi:1,4-dihydroxy-6-naphthoate synthase
MKLTLGFSPCPNDTFIFEAIVKKRIELEGLDFEFIIADVEELNRRGLHAGLDITKISFSAYLQIVTDYVLLNSGSALGENCGPLLVSKKDYCIDELDKLRIAIPGHHTTAYLLLRLLFPKAVNVEEMLFSDIEQALLEEKTDVGLVIHESRFTYSQKGLRLIADLGKFWENKTGTPLPLGGIIARRSLPVEVIAKVDRLIRRSVEFAFANPDVGWDFIKSHAQETDNEVIRKHIGLYVNQFTLDLGSKGKSAIETLFNKAAASDKLEYLAEKLFL